MAPAIKVLLIEDNRIEARQTQHWLGAAQDGSFETEWVEQLQQAADRLPQGGIDIILLDLNLPDSRGLETFDKIHSLAPDLPVVVLTGEYDESIGPSAVERGAQDYLVKQQANAAVLARILRFSLTRHRAQAEALKTRKEKVGKVFGILGAKGGSGTSTVAVNVAVSLITHHKKSVILAELRHTFGTIACQLHDETPRNLSPLLELPPEQIDDHELALLLANGPAGLRILFGPQVQSEYRLIDAARSQAIVKNLAIMADFVFVEFANQPSAALQAAAHLCDGVIVVLEREPGSVQCAKAAVRQLTNWGVIPSRVAAVIVNRTVLPISMGLSDVRAQLGCEVIGVVPPATLECLHAESKGLPLVLAQPSHEAALSYMEIAQRLSAGKIVPI